MKSKLKILISEFDIAWEDPHKNRGFLDELLKGYEADLILMPEMFTTGFSMNPNEIAEPAFSDTFRWMKALAKKKKCAVAGTVSTRENEKFLNRFYFVTPDKEWHYDKNICSATARKLRHTLQVTKSLRPSSKVGNSG